MNELTKTQLTMSSREIAELVNSRHDKVKQSIERLADKGVIGLPPMGEVKNHLGQSVQEYRIGKRDSYIVVAQLSPEFTAKLVDRWQELESQVASNPIALPKTYLEALKALVAETEEKEKLQQELEEAKPSLEFVEEIELSGLELNVSESVKLLANGSLTEKDFRQALIHKVNFIRKDKNEATAWAISKGYMRQRLERINGFVFSVPVLTGKGLVFCRHMLRTGELFVTTPSNGIRLAIPDKSSIQ